MLDNGFLYSGVPTGTADTILVVDKRNTRKPIENLKGVIYNLYGLVSGENAILFFSFGEI
jgi:hypothetical protein